MPAFVLRELHGFQFPDVIFCNHWFVQALDLFRERFQIWLSRLFGLQVSPDRFRGVRSVLARVADQARTCLARPAADEDIFDRRFIGNAIDGKTRIWILDELIPFDGQTKGIIHFMRQWQRPPFPHPADALFPVPLAFVSRWLPRECYLRSRPASICHGLISDHLNGRSQELEAETCLGDFGQRFRGLQDRGARPLAGPGGPPA